MSDIATISLRVNTSELERGNKALDDFNDAAGAAAKGADNFGESNKGAAKSTAEAAREINEIHQRVREFTEAQKQNQNSTKGATQATGQQRQELQNLLNRISPVNRALNDLDELQTSLSKHRGNLDTETYARFNAILDTTRTKLSQVMESETAEGRARQEQAQNAERAAASQKAFLQSLTDQAAAFKSSKADIAEYRAAQLGISQQAAPVIARLREQEQAITREADQKRAAAIAARGLKQALAEQESAERAVAAESKRAAAAQQTFIESLQSQVTAIDKTRSELLELKAAQLGVSSQAAPMIARLRDQENAWKRGEISAGQYRQAMRMLPAQFTDIATSIAGGMPIWMIAIQQGGQIKDSFGGISNTLKALGSFINPVNVGLALLTGTATLLTVAYFKGSAENEEFNKQLILTGNYAGQTAGKLSSLAKSISGSGVTQYAAASALAEVVGSGKFNADKFETVTRAAVAMQQATSKAVSETIADFKKLYDDPTRASTELNNQMHYLTAAQFEYISELERRGDKEAAGQAAADAYSRAEQQRSQQILNNLGLVERAANTTRNALKGMWDELLNIGRPQAPQDMLKGMQDQLATLEKNLLPERQRMGYGYSYDTSLQDQEYDTRRKAQLAAITSLKARISPMLQVITLQEDLNGAISEGNKVNDGAINAQQVINRYLDAGTSAAEKRRKAQDELNKAIADNAKAAKFGSAKLWTSEDIAKARDGIEKMYKDPKPAKEKAYVTPAGDRAEDAGQSELLALQAQYQVLQQHSSINDVISQQRKDLWKTESQFTVLEEAARTRQLSKQEQSLLASKEQVLQLARQKALLGDQITAQEQLNKRMDTVQKYATQIGEKTEALKASSTMSDRQAQRELSISQLKSGWKNAGGSLEDDGYKAQEKAARDYYSAEDAMRSDWVSGAKKGWSEFADGATNMYSQMQSISQNAFTGMASTLTDFFTTGKASFKDFLTTFLKGIAQMLIQLAMVRSARAVLGGTSVGSFLGFASGGAVPAFDGGGYTGNGGKYEPKGVVHGGEFVFTKEATQRIGVSNLYGMMRGYADGGVVDGAGMMYGASSRGAAGVNVQTSVTVNTGDNQQQSASQNAALTKAYQQTIDRAVTEGIQKQTGQGGIIWQAMQKR